jgi:hypothetical protein
MAVLDRRAGAGKVTPQEGPERFPHEPQNFLNLRVVIGRWATFDPFLASYEPAAFRVREAFNEVPLAAPAGT